jgi:hypothetical protein
VLVSKWRSYLPKWAFLLKSRQTFCISSKRVGNSYNWNCGNRQIALSLQAVWSRLRTFSILLWIETHLKWKRIIQQSLCYEDHNLWKKNSRKEITEVLLSSLEWWSPKQKCFFLTQRNILWLWIPVLTASSSSRACLPSLCLSVHFFLVEHSERKSAEKQETTSLFLEVTCLFSWLFHSTRNEYFDYKLVFASFSLCVDKIFYPWNLYHENALWYPNYYSRPEMMI